jgi:hypothetical protein
MTLDKVYIDNMKNIRLSVIHPSTHLVFDREDSAAITAADGGRPYQVFTVEASSLHAGGRRPLWSCIYDDATDVGFYLESMRTGKQEIFYLSGTKYSPAGGVAHWIFKPVNQDIRMEIIVFND